MYVFKGYIKSISDVKSGTTKTGKEWKSIEVLISDEEQAPQQASFKLFSMTDEKYGNKVDHFIKRNAIGLFIEIEFKLKCNEYNGKYYNELTIWKVLGQENKVLASEPKIVKPKEPVVVPIALEGSDELPF